MGAGDPLRGGGQAGRGSGPERGEGTRQLPAGAGVGGSGPGCGWSRVRDAGRCGGRCHGRHFGCRGAGDGIARGVRRGPSAWRGPARALFGGHECDAVTQGRAFVTRSGSHPQQHAHSGSGGRAARRILGTLRAVAVAAQRRARNRAAVLALLRARVGGDGAAGGRCRGRELRASASWWRDGSGPCRSLRNPACRCARLRRARAQREHRCNRTNRGGELHRGQVSLEPTAMRSEIGERTIPPRPDAGLRKTGGATHRSS